MKLLIAQFPTVTCYLTSLRPKYLSQPHDLYSRKIIRIIKQRIMRLTGHVGCMETRNLFMLLRWACGEKGCLEDVGADGRIIIKRVFKNWDESVRDGFFEAQNRNKQWDVVNKVLILWSSIKCVKILDCFTMY